ILTIHYQPQRRKPFVQANGGILKNRAGLQGKLRAVMLAVALPHAGLFEKGYLLGTALRTLHLAIRPTKLNHLRFAVLKTTEVDDRLLKCFQSVHALRVRFFVRSVKY